MLSLLRVLFIFLGGVVGYYVGSLLIDPQAILGAQIGCVSSLIIIFIERQLRNVSVRGLSSAVFGLVFGILMAKILTNVLTLLPLGDFVQSVSEIVLTIVFSYLGAVMALRGKDEFNIIIPYVRFKRQDEKEGFIIIDTSAIIDGRIPDIYKANFMSGSLIVPKFVLKELQALADSADDLKRQKGRRGMELLKLMQDDPKIDIHIHEGIVSDDQEVDARLIRMAKMFDARLCTTDFNLSRIAELQSIEVLNVHQLVSAIKSVVVTGDQIQIKLIKQGKEQDQALAYLDDGTMIVVSNGKEKIGKKVDVEVTSVLQTQTGKLIFAKLI